MFASPLSAGGTKRSACLNCQTFGGGGEAGYHFACRESSFQGWGVALGNKTPTQSLFWTVLNPPPPRGQNHSKSMHLGQNKKNITKAVFKNIRKQGSRFGVERSVEHHIFWPLEEMNPHWQNCSRAELQWGKMDYIWLTLAQCFVSLWSPYGA